MNQWMKWLPLSTNPPQGHVYGRQGPSPGERGAGGHGRGAVCRHRAAKHGGCADQGRREYSKLYMEGRIDVDMLMISFNVLRYLLVDLYTYSDLFLFPDILPCHAIIFQSRFSPNFSLPLSSPPLPHPLLFPSLFLSIGDGKRQRVGRAGRFRLGAAGIAQEISAGL